MIEQILTKIRQNCLEMGIESLTIFLNEKSIFYAGEVISGFCQVHVSTPVQISSIQLSLQGYARVHWTETSSRTYTDSQGHQKSESYTEDYSSCKDLICLRQDIVVQGGFLQPGLHSLPFAFQTSPQ